MSEASGANGSKSIPSDNRRAAGLLYWYDQRRRTLPWRENRDPYRVWISEIMLQQTRVEAVLAYYDRFLDSFRTVEALACASDDEVRSAWSGLGYYRRAIALRDSARLIAERGCFPNTVEGWLELPGVGPYTAAAVMSIVHGARVAAIDGNLERVLSRVVALERRPKTVAGRRALENAALAWLDHDRPGDSNQALMELGATVCRPRNPLCAECPLVGYCRARLEGRQEEFPYRRIQRKPTERKLIAVVVRSADRFLLFRRDSTASLLSGTWELPWVDANESDPEGVLAARYGGEWTLGAIRGSVRHSITHRRLTVTVTEAERECAAEVSEAREACWSDIEGLEDLAHSSLVRKAARIALA